jgi:hypothetical protein
MTRIFSCAAHPVFSLRSRRQHKALSLPTF